MSGISLYFLLRAAVLLPLRSIEQQMYLERGLIVLRMVPAGVLVVGTRWWRGIEPHRRKPPRAL